MFMIMNVLAANLGQAAFYFQRDSLWKNWEIVSPVPEPKMCMIQQELAFEEKNHGYCFQ
jgi:hypothetical protein